MDALTGDQGAPLGGTAVNKPSGSIFDRVDFVKSSFSFSNGNCVEVGKAQGFIGLRDSKDPSGHVLVFTPQEWDAFVKGVAAGEFAE